MGVIVSNSDGLAQSPQPSKIDSPNFACLEKIGPIPSVLIRIIDLENPLDGLFQFIVWVLVVQNNLFVS